MSLLKQSVFLLRHCKAPNICKLRIDEVRNIKRWVAPTLKELYRRRERIGPEPEKPRSTYLEWNYDAEVFAFSKRLGEEFNKNLLKQAFIQKEYANLEQIKAEKEVQATDGAVAKEKVDNFELIQEGEEIISKYIRNYYSKTYPEDVVNALESYLTSTDMLAHVAKHMGITDLVLTTEFPVEKSTLSNTFKAVVAALKNSQDLKRAELFVKDFLICQMNGKDVYDIWSPEAPYKYLTEMLREKGVTAIEPRLCNASACNTILATYQVGIYNNKKLLGIGWGENVDTAKDTAAIDAIQKIHSQSVQK